MERITKTALRNGAYEILKAVRDWSGFIVEEVRTKAKGQPREIVALLLPYAAIGSSVTFYRDLSLYDERLSGEGCVYLYLDIENWERACESFPPNALTNRGALSVVVKLEGDRHE